MSTVFTREVPAGFTTAQFQAALISLLTEAWGAPTYYVANAARPFGFNTVEWPDYEGAKVFFGLSSSTGGRVNIGTSATYAGGVASYKNVAQTVNLTFVPTDNTEAARMVAITGTGYRWFGFRTKAVNGQAYIGTLRELPTFWGTKRAIFIGDGAGTATFMLGENPWGAIDGAGNASPAGIVAVTTSVGPINSQNSLLGKRQLMAGVPAHNTEATLGLYPEDWVLFAVAGSLGVPVGFALADAGEDGLYMTLRDTGNRWAVKVPEAPWPDLTVYPAYVYKLAGEAGEAGLPEYGTTGQCWPRPEGLVFPQP